MIIALLCQLSVAIINTDKMATKKRSKSVYQQPFDSQLLQQQPCVRRNSLSQKVVTDMSRLPSYPQNSDIVTGPSPRRLYRHKSNITRPDHSLHHSPPLPRQKSPNPNKLPGISSPSRPVKLPKSTALQGGTNSTFLSSIQGKRMELYPLSPNATTVFSLSPLSQNLKSPMSKHGLESRFSKHPSFSPLIKNKKNSPSPLLKKRVSLQEQPDYKYFRALKGIDSRSNSPADIHNLGGSFDQHTHVAFRNSMK